MATASPLRKLEDKVMCSICLDYLKDPVTINCSHIFCYHCIIKVCESAQQPLYCSLCKTAFKKENIRHVWQMASIVKNIWRMKVDEERQPREDRPLAQRAEQLCGQHLEKLHYYCKDDQQILCVVCQESREHRHHAAVLLEKAAQPYQGKILNHLKILKGDRDRIQNFQSTGEDEIQALLAKFQSHKQDIASVFEQGHQFLREREQYLLEWLEGTEQQLTEGRNSHVAKGSEEVIRLETLISELEKKAQQPAVNFCRQDARFWLGRPETIPRKKFWIEKPISPAIRKWIEEFSDKLLCLEKGLRGFHGKGRNSEPRKPSFFLCNVSLSFDHGCTFSEFLHPGVLGSKGFTWGKVYWEVKVDRICGKQRRKKTQGDTGLEAEAFGGGMVSGKWNMAKILPGGGGKRVSGEKGISQLHPQGGFWTLQLSSAGVSICTSPGPFQILSYCPQKIGVALDHDGGTVTFTNARTQEFICEFSSAFTGRIFPFLWLNCMRSRLMLRP
uniref:Uncharacterized protein n=1 Tax=Bos mutus grunniens TaxID=30521 RepID=A0A8C0AHR9_BOSMU